MKNYSSLLRSLILEVRNGKQLPSDDELLSLTKAELLQLESDQSQIISKFKSESIFNLTSMKKRLMRSIQKLNEFEESQKAAAKVTPTKKQTRKCTGPTKKSTKAPINNSPVQKSKRLAAPKSPGSVSSKTSVSDYGNNEKPDFQKIINHINEIEEMLKNRVNAFPEIK